MLKTQVLRRTTFDVNLFDAKAWDVYLSSFMRLEFNLRLLPRNEACLCWSSNLHHNTSLGFARKCVTHYATTETRASSLMPIYTARKFSSVAALTMRRTRAVSKILLSIGKPLISLAGTVHNPFRASAAFMSCGLWFWHRIWGTLYSIGCHKRTQHWLKPAREIQITRSNAFKLLDG